MKRVLTHIGLNTWATGLLAVVGTLITGVALADGPEPSANPAGEQLVKIRSQSFENRRFGDETMTWVVQKSLYEDGLTVLTLAGLQFEESFGLTVALLDDVVPTNVETSAQKNGENPAQLPTNKTIEDGFRNPDNEISGNPPRLQLKVRSLLVDVGELKEKPILRQTVPLCENGQRRAIVYLRAAQLGRQLDLSASDAQKLSRLARAACVRWEGVPATSNAAEKDSKIPAQIDARSQPGAADPKN